MKTPLKYLVCVIASASALFFASCREGLDHDKLYTFTGSLVSDFLEDNSEVFSDFIFILKRSGHWSLMSAYGTYTCFAPTNEAVERFLVAQDSIWRASLLPGAEREIWTGVTSPVLEELSDSMCRVIAGSHLLGSIVLTTNMEGDVLPEKNFNDRYLTLRYDVDENLHSMLFVNGAQILVGDEEVENGVVHTMGAVLNPSTNTLPTQISDIPFLTIFSDALKVTGLADKMEKYIDEDYECPGELYPVHRYFGYTAFCEPDELFASYGIHNINELYAHCKEWYPNATDPDYTSPDNALWQFMAYHLLDRKLIYSRAVFHNMVISRDGALFRSEVGMAKTADRDEFLETMQGTMIKLTRPLSIDTYGTELLLNFSHSQINYSDIWHCTAGYHDTPVNVHVKNPLDVLADPESYPGYDQDALNGSILLIDDVLLYDEDVMAGSVLKQIIRLDVASLFPELTNNSIRWGYNPNYHRAGYYNVTYLPKGYCDGLIYYTENPGFRYLGESDNSCLYQSDEFVSNNEHEYSMRLPHVPAGTYEIRMCYAAHPTRGVAQFFFDDVATGIPLNLALTADDPLMGWIADAETEDNGVANDKQMKNRGFLKGSTTFYGMQHSKLARDTKSCIRLVITTKYLGTGDHWLRPRSISGACEMDFLELVPIGWMRDENVSLEEKRK